MAVNNINISTNERLQLNEESINSGTIDRKFGRPEDFIELHIYNQQNQLLISDYNFTQYKFPEDSSENLVSELNMDPVNILKLKGYTSGQYKLIFNIQRSKIFNTFNPSFSIKEISPTRRELKVITPKLTNEQLDPEVSRFIREIDAAAYLKDFVLNFNDDINVVGVNLALNKNTNKHEVLIKLIDSLPSNINISDNFRIVEEITDPVILNVDLGLEINEDEGIPLQGPNFKIDVRLNNSVPSSFKNFDEVLEYSLTSSYHNLLNHLENREIPDISYDFLRTVSGSNEGDPLEEVYHFENFTHFSSAVERLKNFEYKIKLIELYDSQTTDINSITGPTSASVYTLENKEAINIKKQNLIKGFDGYERFLYYTSGTFAWPKQDPGISPYTLYPITSSEVKTWLGSEIDTSPNYGGQLLSASLFDRQNENALTRLVPNHIMDNPNNSFYSSFVNMIGQHFDQIWVHIKHLTEVNDSHHTRGISKELVYFSLKSLGLETFDQFENANLIEYILGEGTSGSVFYDTPQSQSLVTASIGSVPKSDITKNIWKRLYHNAPYLLKTKGTERGLRALMSCYGIPSTILNVKEYGGSTSDKTTYQTFTNEKSSLSFDIENANFSIIGSGSFIQTSWSSSLTNELSSSAKTVEFRIKPKDPNPGIPFGKQFLWCLADYEYQDYNTTSRPEDTRIYLSLNKISTNEAVLILKIRENTSVDSPIREASSIPFPAYNGEFWNIFIGTDTTEFEYSDIVDPNIEIHFGAYQANALKNVNYYRGSMSGFSKNQISQIFGLAGSGSMTHIAGNSISYFGGYPRHRTMIHSLTSSIKDNLFDNYRSTVGDSYKGSIQEIRYYFGELLSHETLKKHALEPFMYAGNTVSSSYENLVFRLPMGSDDKREILHSNHPNDNVNYLSLEPQFIRINHHDNTGITTTLDGLQTPDDDFGDLFHMINHSDVKLPDGSIGAKPVKFNGTGGVSSQSNVDGHITFDLNTILGFSPIVGGFKIKFKDHFGNHKQVEILGSNDNVTFTSLGIELVRPEAVDGFGNLIPENLIGSLKLTNTDSYRYYRLKFNDQFPAGNVPFGKQLIIVHLDLYIYPNYEKSTIFSGIDSISYEESIENHYTPTPDTVGISATSEKTRIDTGTIDDNWLSPTRKTETSTLDNQPPDYEDLGVFFSPTNEINEDIIYTLGAFRLDDYIGSPLPSQQTASKYKDLDTIKNIYFKKVKRRYNYWDYIKLIQYIDHTLFKLVEQWVPMKANLKTGLLIEPHYLERTKFARELPVIDDDQTMVNGSYNTINSEIEPNRSFNLDGSAVITTNNIGKIFGNEVKIEDFQFSGILNNSATVTGFGNLKDNNFTTYAQFEDFETGFSLIYTFRESINLTKIKLSQKASSVIATDISISTSLKGGTDEVGNEFIVQNNVTGLSNTSNKEMINLFNGNVEAKKLKITINNANSTVVRFYELHFFGKSLSEGEVGTNATINLNDYIVEISQEAAQAPIKPYSGSQPVGYVARKSSTLLGNATKGRLSRRYYRKLDNSGKETEY